MKGMQVDSPGSVLVASVRQGVLCSPSSLDAMRHSGTDTRRQRLDGEGRHPNPDPNQPHSKRPLERLHSLVGSMVGAVGRGTGLGRNLPSTGARQGTSFSSVPVEATCVTVL